MYFNVYEIASSFASLIPRNDTKPNSTLNDTKPNDTLFGFFFITQTSWDLPVQAGIPR